MTLRDLLESHGLAAHVAAFEAERLTLEDLPSLTDEDLRGTLGMTALMDRKRFRAAVATLAGTTPTLEGATRVEPPASGPPPSLVGATHLDAGTLPQRLGSYRVLGMVGAGGMGAVVRARHAEEGWAQRQGGDVAIKLVHAHLAGDPAFRDRFFSEAELGRRVTHPGLVQIWDVLAEGPWLGTVMSLVEGEPLSSRVRAGGLPVDEVATLLAPVGAALDHLHAQGIVHRDVKPANVVVRPDGRAVLLDLGIAKDTQAGESHTRTMTTMGTSAWMAPEQADAKHVDGAADRYAFGLMAYALVSGRMPWDEGTSEARVFANKLTGQLVPLAQARPGLPEGVYASVTRMLALAPGERPGSCAALVEGLREGSDPEEIAEIHHDLETLSTFKDHQQVHALVDAAWRRLDGVPPADPAWQMAIRAFDLQWEHARRAKVSRQDRLWDASAQVVLQHETAARLKIAIDWLQTNQMTLERGNNALIAWSNVPGHVREVLLMGRERGHGLLSRIHAALDAVTEPWGASESGNAGEMVADTLALLTGGREIQTWQSTDPTAGMFRLIALAAGTHNPALSDFTRIWLLPNSPAHTVLSALTEPADLQSMSAGERRALARLCAMYLQGDNPSVRELPWGGSRGSDPHVTHAWAWRVLIASRGFVTEPYANLHFARWFRLVLGNATVTTEMANEAMSRAVWEHHALFPPPGFERIDVRIAHALLGAWPALWLAWSHGNDRRLERYLVHWPANGMAQLLAPRVQVDSQGSAEAPVPRFLPQQLFDIIDRPGVDLGPVIEALHSLMAVLQGPDAPILQAAIRGNVPSGEWKGMEQSSFLVLRYYFTFADPRAPHLVALRRHLAQPTPDLDWRALLTIIAALPPSALDEASPQLSTHLFRGVRGSNVRLDEGIRSALAEAHPWLHTVLYTATFLGLADEQAKAAWRKGFRGTPAALCFAHVSPDELPPDTARCITQFFRGESPLIQLQRFAGVMERTAPRLVVETVNHVIGTLPQADLFEFEFRIDRPRDHAPGGSTLERFEWLRRHWGALRSENGLQFGAWRAVFRVHILAANYNFGFAGIAFLLWDSASRAVALKNVTLRANNKPAIGLTDIHELSFADFAFARDFAPLLIVAILMAFVHIFVSNPPEEYALFVRRIDRASVPDRRHRIEMPDEMVRLMEILHRIRARPSAPSSRSPRSRSAGSSTGPPTSVWL